jgi:exopolyphosphatase/guanosine-5'-triphosphate,3'-diphosphate pyrophosphatase
MKYAAIDIGTNAARLLIGQVMEQNGHTYVQKISYTRVPLRLGFEVFVNGEISKAKSIQFSKTIKAFKLIADVYEVEAIRACATSAMREARNGLEIQQKIKEDTGVDIEIIDGDEEAEIIFSTFSIFVEDKERSFIVIDVGGGSTEISVFEAGQKTNSMSFKIGTIRMLKNKVDTQVWKDIKKWLKKRIPNPSSFTVFGTGGNINKLHKLLGKQFMEPIQTQELITIHERLSQLSIDERIDEFLLKPDRADVIVPACEIYRFVIEQLGATEITVPKIGLSDGIIYTLYLNQG